MFLRPLDNVCLLLALPTRQLTPISTPGCSGTPCVEQAGHEPDLKVELFVVQYDRRGEVVVSYRVWCSEPKLSGLDH